nr:hypothetical protein [Candidatus Brachybacter algidus]
MRWDGGPFEEEPSGVKGPKEKPGPTKRTQRDNRKPTPSRKSKSNCEERERRREIKHMVSTSFWSADSNPFQQKDF